MSEVKISKARLEELLDRDAQLRALEHGGVDNWEWYDESLTEYRKEKDLKEFREDLVNDLLSELSLSIYEPAGSGCGYGFGEDAYDLLEIFVNTWNKGADK